jgi:uncharacterized spore protein YtfJ
MPISCTWLADSKTVRVVMKVMMGVMRESKNDDDDYFCGAGAGGAVGIYPAAPGFQYKMGQLHSIKLDSPPPKTRSICP